MTRSSLRAALPTALALGISTIAPLTFAADKVAPGLGHDLAQKLCASCHLIEPGQSNPPGHVGGPAFQTVANRPDITVETLRTHLKTTHSNSMIPLAMPNPQLTEDELNKTVVYILSLRQQH